MLKRDDSLKIIARSLMETEEQFNHLLACNIVYLHSDKQKKAKGKTCFADTSKTNDKLKLISDVDFVITFYADSDDISDRARTNLMRHELMHVGFEIEEPDMLGEVKSKRYIIPHDIEDFSAIISAEGVDWISQ